MNSNATATDVGGDYEFTTDWFSGNVPVWNALIEQIRPARILEIGSYEGRSAAFAIERCAAMHSVEITCIDTWQGGVEHDRAAMASVEARFDRNLARAAARAANPVRLRKMKDRSVPALAALIAAGEEGAFDFIYVDGSHQAPDVLADAVLSFALLKVGGVLAFDDYLWSNEDQGREDPLNMPKPGVDAFINLYQRRLRVVANVPLYQIYVTRTS